MLAGLFGGLFGKKNPANDYAAFQRRQEEDRQARIASGAKDIDRRFAGYDDNFYRDAAQKYRNWLYPRIDRQYRDAQQDTLFALSRGGQLNSSAAAGQSAKLYNAFQDARLHAEQKAQGASAQMRSAIEGARADALSLLSATADPAAAAAVANARAQAASAPPAYDTLGNIFAGGAGLLIANDLARGAYGKPGLGFSIFLDPPAAKSGSSKTYGG